MINSPGIIWGVTGTGAGAPLADMAYVVAMAKVLRKVRVSMLSDGRFLPFHLLDTIRLHPRAQQHHRIVCVQDASYVDDAVFPLFTQPEDVITVLQSVASSVNNTYAQHGVALNFKQGKSEAMMTWARAGAKAHERAALKLFNGCIPFKGISNGATLGLHITKTYKRMRIKLSQNESVGDEVAARLVAMSNGAKRLQTIIKYKEVELSTRTNIVMMYSITKGFHNSGTWSELTAALYKKLHHAVLKIHRSLLGASVDACDDDAVMERLGAMCPLTIIRLSRLLLSMRIIMKAPFCIDHSLLLSFGRAAAWITTVVTNLKWLSLCQAFNVNADAPLCVWVDCISDNPKKLRRNLVNICRTPFANLNTHWAVSLSLLSLGQLFPRPDCAAPPFKTKQTLAVHRYKERNTKNIVRQYIGNCLCIVCLNMFWTRERAVCHYGKSKTCWRNLVLHNLAGPPLSVLEAVELDSVELITNIHSNNNAGRRRHYVDNPCLLLYGPLLPIVSLTDSSHHELGVGHHRRS